MIRILRNLIKIIKNNAKQHPAAMFFLLFYILSFIAVEGWFDLARPPAKEWLIKNLKKIKVKNPTHYSFAVFGDNKNSHLIFPRLLKKVSRDHEILFAMALGDLVFDGEMEKYRYFFSQVRKNLSIPLLTALGNHELRERGRGLYYELLGPFYYSFHIGDNYFIVIDDANKKGLDLWQWEWLEKELQQAAKYTHRFVFMHVPLFDPRTSKKPFSSYHHCLPAKAGQALLELFKKYKVTHIFASHIHAYYKGEWEGIPFTITGGAGGELVGKDPDHDFFHYLKVTISGDDVNIKVVPIPTPDNEWLDRMGSIIRIYLYAMVRFHGMEMALFFLMGYLFCAAFKAKD